MLSLLPSPPMSSAGAALPRLAAGLPAKTSGEKIFLRRGLPRQRVDPPAASAIPFTGSIRRRFWLPPVRWVLSALLVLAAAAPVAYIASLAFGASRNIVFWDEFDTALDLILRLDAGADATEIFRRLFAVNNEHRMLTSRLLFAAGYWLTGTVNFHFVVARDSLPSEDFQIGLLVARGSVAEYVMTEHWLHLADPAAAPPWVSNDS